MKTVAIYPGSFDPITLGHTDIITRAANLFDEVLVTVAGNTQKKPLFSLTERLRFTEEALSNLSNVFIHQFDGLLMNFAKSHNVNIVIRGLRAVSDFDYEFQLAGMNRQMAPEIETIFLTPAAQYGYISSSLVKEIAQLGGDVSAFVPANIEAALKTHFNN